MIVYFSSFLSPHVKPFCDYLYESTAGNFNYVETQKLTDERKAMGYSYAGQKIPYLRTLVSDRSEWYKIADSADCVLINPGSSDYALTAYCVEQNKVVFMVSERIFKRGIIKLADPRLWKQFRINLKSRKYKTYLLCLGSFVARDFSFIGFPKKRTYKFGYFPESLFGQNDETSANGLLWIGRMIDWKRPLFAVKIAEYLKKHGYHYSLKLAGDGPLLTEVQKYVASHKLQDIVDVMGFVDNEEVRTLMRKSSALLTTSTKREGWGAVVNEAMDAGVPVISASEVGAAGYLIKDGVNGFIYNTHSIRQAAEAVLKITPGNQQRFNKNAKATLNVWNAQEAGKRFLNILNLIEGGNSSPDVYTDGPMSKA